MRVIGLHGAAESGKDEVGAVLAKTTNGEVIVEKFALGVYDCVWELNPIVGVIGSQVVRIRDLVPGLRDRTAWEKAKKHQWFGAEVRALLQRMGTEVGRHTIGESVWCNALDRRLVNHFDYEVRLIGVLEPELLVVITDVRFSNEAELVRAWGGQVWEIVRPGHDNGLGSDHASEKRLPAELIDLTITNDDSLEILHERAVDALEAAP